MPYILETYRGQYLPTIILDEIRPSARLSKKNLDQSEGFSGMALGIPRTVSIGETEEFSYEFELEKKGIYDLHFDNTTKVTRYRVDGLEEALDSRNELLGYQSLGWMPLETGRIHRVEIRTNRNALLAEETVPWREVPELRKALECILEDQGVFKKKDIRQALDESFLIAITGTRPGRKYDISPGKSFAKDGTFLVLVQDLIGGKKTSKNPHWNSMAEVRWIVGGRNSVYDAIKNPAVLKENTRATYWLVGAVKGDCPSLEGWKLFERHEPVLYYRVSSPMKFSFPKSEPAIQWKEKSPMLYEAVIPSGRDPSGILVFNVSFHPGWYLEGCPSSEHFTVNGFANGWRLNKTSTGPVTLRVRYRPESAWVHLRIAALIWWFFLLALGFWVHCRWHRDKSEDTT